MQNAVSDGEIYRSGWCADRSRDAPQAGRPARGKTGGAAITDSTGVLRIRRKCREGGRETESA